jgi:hypothetical protein
MFTRGTLALAGAFFELLADARLSSYLFEKLVFLHFFYKLKKNKGHFAFLNM